MTSEYLCNLKRAADRRDYEYCLSLRRGESYNDSEKSWSKWVNLAHGWKFDYNRNPIDLTNQIEERDQYLEAYKKGEQIPVFTNLKDILVAQTEPDTQKLFGMCDRYATTTRITRTDKVVFGASTKHDPKH